MKLRRATVEDVKDIYNLIKEFSDRGLLLKRTMSNIFDNIRDFFIIEENNEIAGIGSLHVCWEDLGEIRSLCVKDEFAKKGFGRELVRVCLEDAKSIKLKRVFVLTYNVDFFKKIGFEVIDKKLLPHKVWAECVNCPKFPECDEVAMIFYLK